MSTEDNNNAPQAADTGVSFANDVEDQQAERKSSTELRESKDRASLSASAKAWDLDGDGELDDAEMALRDMDKGHKGTLNKEQMYKLMSDNLKTQRELFKVKKVVIGLVVFTCILALSNLGTSFAAAFLAKDTKSTDDTLTDAKTGRTLGTQTTSEIIVVDKAFHEDSTRRRMAHCTGGNGNIAFNCVWDGLAVSTAHGEDIVNKCESGKTVMITRSFSSSDTTVVTQVCPALSGSIAYADFTNGNGKNPSPRKMTVPTTSGDSIVVAPDVAGGAGTEYIIVGLVSAQSEPCDDNSDCLGNYCDQSNWVCTTAPVAEPAPASNVCSVDSECASSLGCEYGLCKCESDNECSVGFKCLEGSRGVFIGSLTSRRLSALPPGSGGATSYCLCDQTDPTTALSSCPGDAMCTIECGISPDLVSQSCMTQDQLNSNCALNYNGTNTCDTTTSVSPGMPGQCILAK